MVGRRLMIVALAGLFASAASAAAIAGPPVINSISLRGLQIGGKTTIAIDGSDFLPAPRLMLLDKPVFAWDGILAADLRPGGTPQHVEFDVTVGPAVDPGIYQLRIVTAGGISNPVLIGLDSLAQIPVTPLLTTLPAAISGTIGGGQVVQTSFALKKDEQIVVEVEAKRIGGALDPEINLLDERKVPLAWAAALTALGGDARLRFTAPADGQYTVQLHDALYQAGNPGQFRLKIGAWQFADLVFPPAVQRGHKATLEFASTNLPASAKAEFRMWPDGGDEPARWPDGSKPAGFRPIVLASDDEEVLKSPPADGKLQSVTAPVGISGRFDKTETEDRYRVAVTPGMKLRFELVASRIGSPLDGVLTIRDEKGNQLAMNDDQPMTVDPGLDFTVPANTTAVVVAVKDVTGHAGPDYVYHLAISQLDRPDFSLSVSEDRQVIPLGGSGLIRVAVNRAGYQGPIKLKVDFWGSADTEIPPWSDMALVPLAGWRGAPDEQFITISGRGTYGKTTIARPAEVTTANRETLRQPWLRSEIALALSAEGGYRLEWAGVSAEPTAAAGGKLPLSIKVMRGGGATPALRLSLVTTQQMPKKKVRVNNMDQMQDDLDRTLRLEGSPVIAAGQNDATMQLLVPADLPLHPYDLAIRGEILSDDGKSVVATTYSPVLRVKFAAPVPSAKPPEKKPDIATTDSSSKPLAIFEDQPEFVANLNQGAGQIELVADDKYSGKAAVKVTPDQRFNPALPGLAVKIREKPGPGEYRYLSFAWKKKGGNQVCFQLNHDGQWGPAAGADGPKFRYHAGPGQECFGASMMIDPKLPDGWVLVTRDLFADFGEFTLTGIALSPIDGDYALFDHIYLAQKQSDLDKLKP